MCYEFEWEQYRKAEEQKRRAEEERRARDEKAREPAPTKPQDVQPEPEPV
jgi:hypothetical protein